MDELTERERQMLHEAENAAILRDLYHFIGWEVYCRFARQRIEQLFAEYLREDLTNEQILDRHIRLQAITDFQNRMEDLVRGAVDHVTSAGIRDIIVSSRFNPDV